MMMMFAACMLQWCMLCKGNMQLCVLSRHLPAGEFRETCSCSCGLSGVA